MDDDSASDASVEDNTVTDSDEDTPGTDIFTTTVPPEQDKTDDEDDEETDQDNNFWTMLIQETVAQIVNERLADGIPGPVAAIHNVEEMLEGKTLSKFISRMRDRYNEIKDIADAADDDSLMNMIQSKSEKILDTYGETNGDFKDAASESAWKKYKFLLKKKITDNSAQLEQLVGGKSATSDSDDSEDDNDDVPTNMYAE